MSVEMYLRLDGVSGGTKNYSYRGWSDVLSWHWELLSNRVLPHVSDADRTSFGEISITKPIGMDSTAVMLLYAQGKTIPSVELNVVPVVSKREAKLKYLAMHMENVLVKSIVTGGSTSEDSFNEHVVLIFNSIRFEYNLHTVATPGENDASSVDYQFSWDIERNKEWKQTAA